MTQNVADLEALLRGAEAIHVMDQQIVIISTPDQLPAPEGDSDAELLLFATPQPARLETATLRPALERPPVISPALSLPPAWFFWEAMAGAAWALALPPCA